MEDINVEKLQEALLVIASVCDEHTARPKEHRKIEQSLKLITDTLSKLLSERVKEEPVV